MSIEAESPQNADDKVVAKYEFVYPSEDPDFGDAYVDPIMGVPLSQSNLLHPRSQESQETEYYSYDEESTEEPDSVPVDVKPDDPQFICTDLAHLRAVLATRTNHSGRILSRTLENYNGFLMLPLTAVSMIRFPDRLHHINSKVLVWLPLNDKEVKEAHENYPALIEAACMVN